VKALQPALISARKVMNMPSEKELLERIRQLEEQNNELQDKLDMIYSILAPERWSFPPDGPAVGGLAGSR
jgi:hypothetical protein